MKWCCISERDFIETLNIAIPEVVRTVVDEDAVVFAIAQVTACGLHMAACLYGRQVGWRHRPIHVTHNTWPKVMKLGYLDLLEENATYFARKTSNTTRHVHMCV